MKKDLKTILATLSTLAVLGASEPRIDDSKKINYDNFREGIGKNEDMQYFLPMINKVMESFGSSDFDLSLKKYIDSLNFDLINFIPIEEVKKTCNCKDSNGCYKWGGEKIYISDNEGLLKKINILLHELGHHFHDHVIFNLRPDSKYDRDNMGFYIYTEFIARLFEVSFIKEIKKNNSELGEELIKNSTFLDFLVQIPPCKNLEELLNLNLEKNRKDHIIASHILSRFLLLDSLNLPDEKFSLYLIKYSDFNELTKIFNDSFKEEIIGDLDLGLDIRVELYRDLKYIEELDLDDFQVPLSKHFKKLKNKLSLKELDSIIEKIPKKMLNDEVLFLRDVHDYSTVYFINKLIGKDKFSLSIKKDIENREFDFIVKQNIPPLPFYCGSYWDSSEERYKSDSLNFRYKYSFSIPLINNKPINYSIVNIQLNLDYAPSKELDWTKNRIKEVRKTVIPLNKKVMDKYYNFAKNFF